MNLNQEFTDNILSRPEFDSYKEALNKMREEAATMNEILTDFKN